jgi:trimethylamine--corrinoid protein Co-methyltransferase
MEIRHPGVLTMLADHGARVDREKYHVAFSHEIIEQARRSVPASFKLYDVLGQETHDFSGCNVHFTPGSAAIHILDYHTQQERKPVTSDYIRYAKLASRLPYLAAQSTAFIPSDVHEKIADSYRLFLGLLYGEKPVITGAFTRESCEVMKNFQLAIRGSQAALKEKPLTVFTCCPTSPLQWCEVSCQNLLDCSRSSIPVEIVTMPLAGFIAPVTLVGTLIQHTAEVLSGIVISQLTNPGTPNLYGGSPAIFDIRYETTPLGAIESMMLDVANNEIGKYLHVPTQAYISLSDAKMLDAQAGLETSMGATLAALSGINSVSGPGMLDFENCQSLEKLVLDNEICGMVLRMVKGIEPKEDFPAMARFVELLQDKHLLISKHTRKYLKTEQFFPGQVIDRASTARWLSEGGLTLGARANREVERLVEEYQPSRLPEDSKKEIIALMEREARRYGMQSLPQRSQ